MKERAFARVENVPVNDPPSDDRPIGEIFKDIVGNISEIVRTEIRLVSAELRQEASELKMAAVAVVLGNVLLLYGGIFLLLGLVYALSTVWAPWLSAVAVGLGVGIVGAIVLAVGIGKFKRPRVK
jgi:uncharacterized membrane protein YqjE